MADTYAPDPSQIDWDGSGAKAFAYAPTYAVPVEWVKRETDPISGGYIRSMADGYATPDELYRWVVLEHRDGLTEPHADQLNLEPGALSGNVVVLGEWHWQDTHVTEPAPEWLGELDPIMGTMTQWTPRAWTTDDTASRDGQNYYHVRDGYLTPGQLYVWQQITPDEPDDPDPDPPADDTAERVAAFAGLDPEDDELMHVIRQHVPIVTAQVRAYTRGRGFSDEDGEPGGDVLAVIVSACARSATNPTGASRLSFGELRHEPGTFDGFTLGELAILNPYRKRWA